MGFLICKNCVNMTLSCQFVRLTYRQMFFFLFLFPSHFHYSYYIFCFDKYHRNIQGVPDLDRQTMLTRLEGDIFNGRCCTHHGSIRPVSLLMQDENTIVGQWRYKANHSCCYHREKRRILKYSLVISQREKKGKTAESISDT